MIRRAFALVLAVSALWLGSFDAARALATVRPLLGPSRQLPPNFTPAAQGRAMSCYERCRRNRYSVEECNRQCGE
jgi:hypothetical protein